MNEILLIIIVLLAMISMYYFISRISKPKEFYIRILGSCLLIVLIWFFNPDGKLYLKWLITIIAAGTIVQQMRLLINWKKTAAKQ